MPNSPSPEEMRRYGLALAAIMHGDVSINAIAAAAEALGLEPVKLVPEGYVLVQRTDVLHSAQAAVLAANTCEERAQSVTFRGWSHCRICNKVNGSREFRLGDWCWPSGLDHYVRDHNVRPSQEFIAFITSQREKAESSKGEST